jgi:hypothetical protein
MSLVILPFSLEDFFADKGHPCLLSFCSSPLRLSCCRWFASLYLCLLSFCNSPSSTPPLTKVSFSLSLFLVILSFSIVDFSADQGLVPFIHVSCHSATLPCGFLCLPRSASFHSCLLSFCCSLFCIFVLVSLPLFVCIIILTVSLWISPFTMVSFFNTCLLSFCYSLFWTSLLTKVSFPLPV